MMLETTFNSPYQESENNIFANVHQWLTAFYQKDIDSKNNFSITSLVHLEKKLTYSFKNKKLFIEALTQSTFSHENKDLNFNSNEKLEFLGDSLVNMLVAFKLHEKFSDLNEGELSKFRGALVNEYSLSELANHIELPSNIFLGKGEWKNQGSLKESILADGFEALIAAIYLDSNKEMNVLSDVFNKIIISFGEEKFYNIEKLFNFDSKSMLQETTMSLFHSMPQYRSNEVKDGFKVEIWLNDKLLAFGTGASKKKLEKDLAYKVLTEKLYR